MKIHYFLPLLILGLAGCATGPIVSNQGMETPPPAGAETNIDEKIRVAIAVHQGSVHLVAPESFTLSGFPFGTPVIQKGEKYYRETTLTFDKLYSKKAYIEPLGDGQIEVNGKSFKGSMEIIGGPGGTLTVVNELPLEDYIMGVLAGEIPRATLNKLAAAVTRRHEAFADPKLQDVLDQIELRAHVELAKLEAMDKRVA